MVPLQASYINIICRRRGSPEAVFVGTPMQTEMVLVAMSVSLAKQPQTI